MSDNKLLNENTVRRFMKLANVQTLTDNFIQEKYTKEEALEEQMEPEEEEAPEEAAAEEPAMEEPAGDEMGDEMGEPEMEMGAADISLTEEEAELLIDLGERLKEAMDDEMDDEMDDDMGAMDEEEPMGDEVEEPMGEEAPDTEEAAGYRDNAMQENKDEIVREVLKRVTKRILSNRK